MVVELRRATVWLGTCLALGCGNPCERLCDNLADYAEECGLSVPDADRDACRDAQKGASAEEQDVCSDYGGPEVLRNEWTCDDLTVYWDADAGGNAGTTEAPASE